MCWPHRSNAWAAPRRRIRLHALRSSSSPMPTASWRLWTAPGSIRRMSQFLLPDLGEGLEEAQLVQWLVQVGDAVHLNQPLCQVETAKALVDIPSPFAGTVARLHAEPGDAVPDGAPLVTIEETGAARPAGDTAGTGDGHGPVLVGYGTEGPAQTFTRRRRGVSVATASVAPAATTASPSEAPLSASPLVRKMAAERGIDLATIRGTGPGGRIRVEDLEAAPAAAAPAQPREPAADEERISTIGLRKAIAARMVRAATTIPHFTEYSLFDASALVALRNRLHGDPAYADQHLTVTPFFVRALVEAVKAHPIMNSRWDEEGNAIVVKHSIHVGIATDTPRGLLVPVVANAHWLTLAQLAAECDRLVRLAREGTLDAKSLSGSTITITNVGASGPVDTGAPVINPPEPCAVGFGAFKPRGRGVGGGGQGRAGGWVSGSGEPPAGGGASAAQFMGTLVRHLEQPESLV